MQARIGIAEPRSSHIGLFLVDREVVDPRLFQPNPPQYATQPRTQDAYGCHCIDPNRPAVAGYAEGMSEDQSEPSADEWAVGSPAILADLRQRCPVAHTERFHGAYLVTRYAAMLKEGQVDIEIARNANGEIQAFFAGQLQARRHNPTDDLVSMVLHAEARLEDLCTHPDDLAALVEHPELILVAIEEFLRFYSPVTIARVITEDAEIAGCPVTAGERLLLALPSDQMRPSGLPNYTNNYYIERSSTNKKPND